MAGSRRFKLALARVGYGARLRAIERVSPKSQANRVEYPRGGLTEWYVNGPLGLEQGFTFKQRPAGSQEGPLTLALDLSGTLKPVLDGNTLALSAPGGGAVLRYRGLTALDARGRELPARLRLAGSTLKIEVDEGSAIYPLTIDPFIEQAKLTASDAAAGDSFGESVALSGNGKLAVIGAALADCAAGEACGAAYVFVRKGNKRVEQQKLTASDGTAFDGFGEPVALSADGKTALIGANPSCAEGFNCGAAYVFVRKGLKWVEQQKLIGSDTTVNNLFGDAVALSADGKTALIGAALANSAYVFVRQGGTWNEQQKLTASDGGTVFDDFGQSVTLSADGKTALIGAPGSICANGSFLCGTAYVFVQRVGDWVEEQRLTTSDAMPDGFGFGWSVALSRGGERALIGSPDQDCVAVIESDCGAAYVFVRKHDGWVEEQKLMASDATEGDDFGWSVALRGNVALVGDRTADCPAGLGVGCGAAYVFVRQGTEWIERQKLIASDAGAFVFGGAVALSARGKSALVGARGTVCPDGSFNCGAAYVFRK
ncbi:MAG: FG-GAP repeat protein [Gammaproteobacteria bacterium]